MKTTHQHVSVVAFSGIVTALMGVVLLQNMSPATLSGDLMGRMGAAMSSSQMNIAVPVAVPTASLSSSQMNIAFPMPTDTATSSSQMNTFTADPVLTDADPNTIVVVVTDELGNEVISYTEAQLQAAVMEQTVDGDIVIQQEGTLEPTDGTEPVSTKTCGDQTAKIGKIFTANAGPKGTKLYSYCKEDTMKTVLNEHMDKAVLTFCSSFNANKYTKGCADGCQQVAGVKGILSSFYEKERKFTISKVDDKTCKVVTGESSAYTGTAILTGDCTFTRVCEPFKSKFKEY